MRHRVLIVIAAALVASCGRPPATDPGMVSAWVRTWYGAIRAERLSPPVASRLMAYSSTALYAGLAATRPTLTPLTGALNGLAELPRAQRPNDYDETITAVEAERVVMDSLFAEGLPTTRASVARLADSLMLARVATGVKGAVRARSEALGREIGIAIVAWSRTDGFDGTRGRHYKAPVGPGLWINDTPASLYTSQSSSAASQSVTLDNPANQLRPGSSSDRALILSRSKPSTVRSLPSVNMAGATEPYWREIRPFVLASWEACAVPAPSEFSTAPSSDLLQNAMAVRDTRTTLTDEQRTIALYWADNAGESGTPVGHWLSIASQMIGERGLESGAAARLVLATAIAQADAFIAAWGYKYQYNLIRPRTYIRRVIDPAWEPLIPTPPFPEHPAGHSTQSAAAAAVLTAMLGATAFDDSTSVTLGHAVRHFTDFGAAADEAGLSRVYGGIHFPSGDLAGRALGGCIGAKVVERFPVAAR